MRRTQRLRFLNAAIWIAAITACLFIIGFVTRVGDEWSKTPIDRIGTNNFRFHIADDNKYYIYFQCESKEITASYDLGTSRFRTFPDDIDTIDKAVHWTAINDGEIFSASMASTIVFSGKSAFRQFGNYNRHRLNNVRLIRKAAKIRWVLMAVLSLGGYWTGDYIASKLDIPCRRSNDLDWLKSVDWAALTRAIYDHRVHEVGRCVNSLQRRLKQTQTPQLQALKNKYFGSETLLLIPSMNRSDILRDLTAIYPSPQMTSYFPDDDFDIAIDFMHKVSGKELEKISGALNECRRIASLL